MRIGIGEAAGKQHLVGAQPDARHHVVGFEGKMFDLRVPIDRIFVQHQLADLDQRVIAVRPGFGEVERVDAIGLCIFIRYNLPLERPAGIITLVDRIEQVPAMIIAIFASLFHRLVLRQMGVAAHLADIGVEVELDPELLAVVVYQHVGLAAVAVHLAPVLRQGKSGSNWCRMEKPSTAIALVVGSVPGRAMQRKKPPT